MSIKRTFKLEADVEDALKKIDKLTESVDDLGKAQKDTAKETKSIGGNFKAMGIAKITAGVGLLTKFFGSLWEQMQKNTQIADTVNTVFNSIGVAFKMVTDTLINVYNRVSQSTEGFDALGRVVVNLLNIGITPLKLGFQAIKLGIQSAMLAWEKSFLGGKGKDIERIKELQANIDETKNKIKETANAAWESGKEIVSDFGEAIGEVSNIANVVVEEFEKTFEGVTVKSILKQGQAITQTKKNYELLALEQQRLIEQYDREAEVQRQIRDDVRLSIDERIQANNELATVLEKQSDAEKAAIQAQIDSLTTLNELEGQTPERMQELFGLKTEMLAIDAKIVGWQSEQKTNEASLQDERVANMKELSAIGRSELEQRFLDLENAAAEQRLLAERTIQDETLLAETLLAIDQDLADKRKAIDDEVALKRQENLNLALQQTVQAGTDILGSMSSIAQTNEAKQKKSLDKQLKEGTISQEKYDKNIKKIEEQALKRKKKLAILDILISTAQGVAGAIKGAMVMPFPLNIAALATGVASVLAGIASAKAVLAEVPGGDDGGDVAVDTGGGGGEGGSDPSQIGGDLVPNMENVDQPTLGGEPSTVQAYVVENDISNAQSLQQDLETQSTL